MIGMVGSLSKEILIWPSLTSNKSEASKQIRSIDMTRFMGELMIAVIKYHKHELIDQDMQYIGFVKENIRGK